MVDPEPLTPQWRQQLVVAIHDTPTMLVLAVAGGGNAVITDLLDVGGASRTVLEVVVPYAESAMDDFVGRWASAEVTPVVSEQHAGAMAAAALARARQLAPADVPVAGVAVTAALASDRPKRGEHRAHIAVATADGTVGRERISLTKGALDRLGEDRLVADHVLREIAAVCGVAG